MNLSNAITLHAQSKIMPRLVMQSPASQYYLRMSGQSNSYGVSPVSELDSELTRQFQNVYIWENLTAASGAGSWQKLQAGVNNNLSDKLNYYGAEIKIADLFETNHPDKTLFISKYAIGSSLVAQNALGVPDWSADSTGECLDTALNNFHIPSRAAIVGDVVDLGLVWMQGEGDASSSTYSTTSTFRTNTANMLAKFRMEIGDSSMIAYICRIHKDINRNSTWLSNVRTAQGASSGNLSDQATYAYNRFFSTDAYTLIDDVHFQQQPFGVGLYNTLFP